MRSIILLLAISLALAGCTKTDGNDGGGGVTTTTPTTGGGNQTGGVNETVTHNFASTPGGATKPVEVPNGTATVHVTVTFTSAAPACEAGTSRVVIKDGAGTEVLNTAPGPQPGVGSCGGKKDEDIAVAAGGAWSVVFSGNGAVTATVTIASM